jgi:Zn-dependent protease with chaperone function
VSAVWDRFCGEALDATLAALLVSTVGMIVLVSCRQPARRGWIARGVVLALLLLVPLVCVIPRWPVPPDWLGDYLPPEWVGVLDHNRLGSWTSNALALLLLTAGATQIGWGILASRVLKKLRKSSLAPRPETFDLYAAVAKQVGLRRPPDLRVLDRGSTPALMGAFRPTIILPAKWERPESREALRLALHHELAHARRRDSWFWNLGTLARGIWFFLPQARWVVNQMRLDQELLADRDASHAFACPADYALALLDQSFARTDRGSGGSRPTLAPQAQRGLQSLLAHRVSMLVGCPFPVESAPPAWWRFASVCGLLLLAVVASLLTFRPSAALARAEAAQRREAPAHGRLAISRVAISAAEPHVPGRDPTYTLPIALPSEFEITFDLWAPREEHLAGLRVLGVELLSSHRTSPGRSFATPFRSILARRTNRATTIWLDGNPIPRSEIESIGPQSTTLDIAPAPGRNLLIRNMNITW